MKGQPRLKAIPQNTGDIKKGGVDNHGGINHRVCERGYIGLISPRYSGIMRVIFTPELAE